MITEQKLGGGINTSITITSVMFKEYFTMYGNSSRVMYDDKCAVLVLAFDVGTIPSGAMYDICQLPIKSKYNFFTTLHLYKNRQLTYIKDARLTETGLFRAYVDANDSGSRCYITLPFIPDIE